MTKILTMPGHIEDIREILEYCDAILLGIEGFSVNFTEISINELKDIVEYVKSKDKEIFISLNRNFHNGDLKEVENLLKKCSSWKVNGIFYTDVAVYKIHHRLMLDATDLECGAFSDQSVYNRVLAESWYKWSIFIQWNYKGRNSRN